MKQKRTNTRWSRRSPLRIQPSYLGSRGEHGPHQPLARKTVMSKPVCKYNRANTIKPLSERNVRPYSEANASMYPRNREKVILVLPRKNGHIGGAPMK